MWRGFLYMILYAVAFTGVADIGLIKSLVADRIGPDFFEAPILPRKQEDPLGINKKHPVFYDFLHMEWLFQL
jgi:hypothetical protein